MRKKIKQNAQQLGRWMGLEIRASGVSSREDLRLIEFIKQKNIETIIDVGANDGGFAKKILSAGFKGKIISFEPLPAAHSALSNTAKGYHNWTVAPRLALSDENSTSLFYVTHGDTASSLFEPTEQLISETQSVKIKEIIQVETRRLDDFHEVKFNPSRTLLKLDVQGSEAKVLDGATQTLNSMAGILCEMSLIPIYVGQPNWLELDHTMTNSGFEIWDIWPGYRSPESYRLLQIDGLYFKK